MNDLNSTDKKSGELKPYIVRKGFSLHKGESIFEAGQTVQLSDVQAKDYAHMIEPA